MPLSVPFVRFGDYSELFCWKSQTFSIPLVFGAPIGMTPLEFHQDFRLQKTRVPGLSCGVVCVKTYLAILICLRLVTDTQTDRRTDTGP